MRLLFIRHGDPNYEKDCLTERGRREAELLAGVISGYRIKEAYVSPLGRAAETASIALKDEELTPETCWWLREFAPRIKHPDCRDTICWDWMPEYWSRDDRFYSLDAWAEQEDMREGGVEEEYDRVVAEFDKIIENHGYKRNGRIYDVLSPNHDTIAFFCHFGVECVLLSRLINVSPMQLWHGFSAAPSAVTSVYTEERKKGTASFRVNEFGSVAHLINGGAEPSKRARFVECFGDTEPDYEHKDEK